MIVEKIVTPANQQWGAFFTSEPPEHQFYGGPADNDRAKWKWVCIKDLLRNMIEFQMVKQRATALHGSEPNITFRELIENFRPLMIPLLLWLKEYETRTNTERFFMHAHADEKDPWLLRCHLVSTLGALDMNPAHIYVPAGWSRNVSRLVKELGMHHIDNMPPPGHVEHVPAGHPPPLWAHSLSDTSHVRLELTGGANPRWTWGEIFTTPLGAM